MGLVVLFRVLLVSIGFGVRLLLPVSIVVRFPNGHAPACALMWIVLQSPMLRIGP